MYDAIMFDGITRKGVSVITGATERLFEETNYISALSRTLKDSWYSLKNDNGLSYSTGKT